MSFSQVDQLEYGEQFTSTMFNQLIDNAEAVRASVVTPASYHKVLAGNLTVTATATNWYHDAGTQNYLTVTLPNYPTRTQFIYGLSAHVVALSNSTTQTRGRVGLFVGTSYSQPGTGETGDVMVASINVANVHKAFPFSIVKLGVYSGTTLYIYPSVRMTNAGGSPSITIACNFWWKEI